MQEFYDLSAGEIYSDCRCQSEELASIDKQRPSIDDACYKPTGSDCSWFDTCFTQRYPNCSAHVDADNSTTPTQKTTTGPNAQAAMTVVDFQKKFCALVEQRNEHLSDLARLWLGQVRKCFVDKLAPLVRPWRNEKCDNLEEAVFDSYKQCYLKPDLNLVSSICQLDCKSWWLIFKDIKNFFPMSNFKLNRIYNQYFKFGIKGLTTNVLRLDYLRCPKS